MLAKNDKNKKNKKDNSGISDDAKLVMYYIAMPLAIVSFVIFIIASSPLVFMGIGMGCANTHAPSSCIKSHYLPIFSVLIFGIIMSVWAFASWKSQKNRGDGSSKKKWLLLIGAIVFIILAIINLSFLFKVFQSL